MTTKTGSRRIVVESAEAVLGLHWFVSRDFTVKEEGIEIEIITPGIRTRFDWSDPRSHDHHLVTATNYQKAFDEGRADIYRACEWGQIRRSYDNPQGPIVARRPAMVYQGVFTRPDSPIHAPIALANRSVGVQFHQGSHYATLSMLEGFLPREQINVVHAGTVLERYESLMDGEIDAATLMEPWVTLAEKQGCKLLVGTFYQGTENASESMSQDMFDALMRAVKNAVGLINEDKRRYLHYLLDEIPEKYSSQLSPADFHLPRLRYVDTVPYSEEEFERAYNWMRTWDLVGENAEFDALVSNRI
jgi:NitT/TauT family transport system substrate-binding protein